MSIIRPSGALSSLFRALRRAPALPAQSTGGRFGRGAEPPSEQIAGFAVLLIAVAWTLGAFSAWPWAATAPDAAVLRVSLRRVSGFSEVVRHKSEKEEQEEQEALDQVPRHMRPLDRSRPTTGRRTDAQLAITIDDRTVLARTYRPTGFRHDGPIYAYEEIPMTPGHHRVTVTLVDLAPGVNEESITHEVELAPGAAPLVEYIHGAGWRVE